MSLCQLSTIRYPLYGPTIMDLYGISYYTPWYKHISIYTIVYIYIYIIYNYYKILYIYTLFTTITHYIIYIYIHTLYAIRCHSP